jgi:type VI secretion system protein ImpH
MNALPPPTAPDGDASSASTAASVPKRILEPAPTPPSLLPRAALEALLAQPERYGFFQAVRLLYRSHRIDGLHTGSGRETVRFAVPDSLSFPAGEIAGLQPAPAQIDAEHRLIVNFFGLTGPSGVLPRHYTRWLIARARARDPGPREFFELFNHRLLLLFWHAWRKHRPEIALEFGLGQGVLRHIYDLVGMGTPALFGRMYPATPARTDGRSLPGAALAYYSGLISQQPHGIGSLSQVVGDVVGAPATAQGCLGSWQRIAMRDRTRLGRQAHALGDGCVLGTRYWDRQTTLQLRIGPLDRAHFEALLPDGGLLAGVVELARFLTGLALDLRIKLALSADQVRPVALGARGAGAARLGWNTWLSGRRSTDPADEVEFHFSAMGGESWQ